MDMLEKLANVPVPPVPEAKPFDAGMRRKLHPRLLAAHIVEFAFEAMPMALLCMIESMCAAIQFTITGSWLDRGNDSSR